jgi:hypothetical protein
LAELESKLEEETQRNLKDKDTNKKFEKKKDALTAKRAELEWENDLQKHDEFDESMFEQDWKNKKNNKALLGLDAQRGLVRGLIGGLVVRWGSQRQAWKPRKLNRGLVRWRSGRQPKALDLKN